jgi:hypothetical protein
LIALAAIPPSRATAGRFEAADGDLVRCGLAPYFFRVRRDGGGAMLLEPVGAAEAAALAAAGALADEHQAQAEAAHEPGEPRDGDQGSGHGSLPSGPVMGRVLSSRKIARLRPSYKGSGDAWDTVGGKERESGGGTAHRTVPRPRCAV